MSPARTRIKICGLTNLQDALEAVAAGADALGFISHKPSPRHIDLVAARWIAALPPFITRVAVLVDPAPEFLTTLAGLKRFDAIQFHGNEGSQIVQVAKELGFGIIKAFRPTNSAAWREMALCPVNAILADTPTADGRLGGSGLAGDWESASRFTAANPSKALILSGGLRPDNVASAIEIVRPFAVDVCSGVERAHGLKDSDRLHAFCDAVRASDAARRTP